MEDFSAILLFVALIAMVVFLVLSLVSKIKKDGKAKRKLIYAGGSFVVMIISFIIFGSVTTGTTTTTADPAPAKEQPKVETAKLSPEEEAAIKEEAEAAAKAKAAEEAKAKAEAEEKAKAEAAAKAKEEAEANAKAEAEAKAAAEAEAKAKAEKKANAQTIEYPHLSKNPDRYAGEYVTYTGEIVQILESGEYTNIRLAVTQNEWGYDYNDLVFVEYEGLTDFVDGDVVTVYGEIYGAYSYTSQAGWEITLPGLVADTVE
ncbi:hypothetical protein TCA2_5981 [Paenibacillus sp. TCA20]|uniref:hypothetical protein n=1 Tax=Paenibacillus sp. TCA20 TaxID=1499968 RepID=UPI0004D6928D|nr:hypothetical protein [Paenibacillus sp. TCA20]GAK43483.1 hypothetical protein TCA2_5981 [Paenibacillus sp. TCA20]